MHWTLFEIKSDQISCIWYISYIKVDAVYFIVVHKNDDDDPMNHEQLEIILKHNDNRLIWCDVNVFDAMMLVMSELHLVLLCIKLVLCFDCKW